VPTFARDDGPLLRWAGSKRKLIPKLLPYWSASGGRYVEPFVGSGALFFAANPDAAVLSDANDDLIQTYTTIRDAPDEVATSLEILPRDKATFLRLRAQSPAALSASAHAARFVFLNRHCFNGLYRLNRGGQFNVPYAPSKTGAVPTRAHLHTAAERLSKATLLGGDFENILSSVVRPDDFVYLDPPFAVANRRLFRQYNATTFGFDDLHRLAGVLHAIDSIGAYFVLSYAMCSESLTAFGNWPHQRVMTQRNISGFSAHRRRAAEFIFSNIRLVDN
jgi:DNA adenine methylase